MDQRILNMTAGQVIEYSRLVSRREELRQFPEEEGAVAELKLIEERIKELGFECREGEETDMDHSLAIRKDPERVWDVPGSETGSRRDRGRVHHRMSFRKRRQLRYAEELLRILEAALGICAIMLMGTGSLWIGMIIMTAGLELSCRYIEKSVKN